MNLKFVERLFTNKNFLYAILFLTIVTVLGYITQRKYDSVLFMIAFGIIIKQFNKNMAVVMIVSVFVTALYTLLKQRTVSGFRPRYESKMKKIMSRRLFDKDGDDDKDENFGEDKLEPIDSDDEDEDDGNEINDSKVEQFKQIKHNYKDLIDTIKEKTSIIKEMTRKMKE